MRKFIYSLAILAPVALLAEGESAGNFDLSSAATAAGTISTAIAGLLTGAVLTGLLAVYGGRVTLWVITKLATWVGGGKK